jgi:4-hydroxybenzoate polyprenyltransferase
MTPDISIDRQHQDIDIPLAVDLDGTLCRTDTLHEALLVMLTTHLLQLLRLPFWWMSEGRAGLKARLADYCIVEPDHLPLNDAVVDVVRAAREDGRTTALVSAADHRQVTAIADAIGLFDEAYGSAEGLNLKGDRKAAFLSQHFGHRMFDYIGDSRADIPIWSKSRKAITVQAGPRLRQAAQHANRDAHHLDPPQGQIKARFRSLRPHQWSKNLLLFLPMIAAHDPTRLVPVLLGFVAFCLTASAVYVINDLIDLGADRAHPRKRNRPFASGELSAATGGAMAPALLICAFVIGLATGRPAFLGILALYFGMTFAYSLWLKRRLIVDVMTLAGLYTVRIIAGAAAAGVVLSPWLLGFSMFLFLSLAAVKRQAELADQINSNRTSSGRAYEFDDLPVLRGIALSAAQASVLVLALYISSSDVQKLYSLPELLWLICPFLLYWSTRMVMKAHRGQMTDDPIVFAMTDRVSLLVILACAVIVTFAAVA